MEAFSGWNVGPMLQEPNKVLASIGQTLNGVLENDVGAVLEVSVILSSTGYEATLQPEVGGYSHLNIGCDVTS